MGRYSTSPRPIAAPALMSYIARAAARPSQGNNAAWILDNFRLIFTAWRRRSVNSRWGCADAPIVADTSGAKKAISYHLLARKYLEAVSYNLQRTRISAAFLEGYQETADLQSSEIWSLSRRSSRSLSTA